MENKNRSFAYVSIGVVVISIVLLIAFGVINSRKDRQTETNQSNSSSITQSPAPTSAAEQLSDNQISKDVEYIDKILETTDKEVIETESGLNDKSTDLSQ